MKRGRRLCRKPWHSTLQEKRSCSWQGILADKEIDSIVKFLTKITDHIIVTEPDNPRKLAAEKLAGHVADFGVVAEAVPDVEAAVHRAKELADGYDVILFAGSLYLIGDVRRLWRNERGEER